MTIQSGICTSFKSQLLVGVHNLSTHVIRCALYTQSAQLTPSTTAYSSTNEVVSAGYTPGGITLTPTITTIGNKVVVDFADVTISDPSMLFTTAGALIYNDTASGNPAIAVLDFGLNYIASGSFTIQFPTPDGISGMIRL